MQDEIDKVTEIDLLSSCSQFVGENYNSMTECHEKLNKKLYEKYFIVVR